MNKPLITIITVCYNAISSIEKTILSVINQTYPNIEYIIIDGGSTDGTIDVIKKYDDNITYWISEPDKGIYDAMNKGIDLAKGEWINFMNCGDTFYSDKTIENVFKKVSNQADIIYGNTNLLVKLGNYIKQGGTITPQKYMPFFHQSSFTKTSLMKKTKFDLKYKICADRNFFYHMFNYKRIFEYVNIVISNYEAEEGLSSLNIIKLESEIAQIEGKDKEIKWKIKFSFFKFYHRIKLLSKKILPPPITIAIKKHNLKKKIKHNSV